MRRIKSYFLPTAENNFRAYLLSNTALVFYVMVLIVANIFGGNVATVNSASNSINPAELVKAHNIERAKIGLTPLSFNSALALSAKAKGEAMLAADCWSHFCPDGKSPWDFFNGVGYVYAYAGENLAEGFSDDQAVMTAWMNSKTHRENILKSQFTEVGIGIVYGEYQGKSDNVLIVVHFGQPKDGKAQTSAGNAGQRVPNSPYSISQPQSGSATNDTTPGIAGSAPGPLEIVFNPETLYEQKSGRLLPNGGLFTYDTQKPLSEGKHEVVARSAANPLDISDSVDFFIDTKAPEARDQTLKFNSLTSSGDSVSVRLQLHTPDELAQAEINFGSGIKPAATAGIEVDDKIWEFTFPNSQLNAVQSLTLIDRARNSANVLVSTATKTALATASADDIKNNQGLVFTDGEVAAAVSVREYLPQLTPLQVAIAMFLTTLCILLAVDVIVIRRMRQQLHLQTSLRTHLHLPAFAVLLILVLFGNLSGVI